MQERLIKWLFWAVLAYLHYNRLLLCRRVERSSFGKGHALEHVV